jgi:hypothetical protein
MESDNFNPTVAVTEEQLKTFLFDTTVMKRLNAKVSLIDDTDTPATAAFPEIEPRRRDRFDLSAENLISGDVNRYWLAGRQYGGSYPFTLEFEVDTPAEIKGLCVMPRQNHRDREGAVNSFEIWTLRDSQSLAHNWELQVKGTFANSFDMQSVYFDKPLTITKLRLKLIDGFGAEDMYYWYTDPNIGHTFARGAFRDKCASLAQVAFILDDTTEKTVSNNLDNLKIDYAESKTASEEIY